MTVASVAVEATKFLFGMWDCTVDSYVGTDDFLLVPGILHVCRHTRTCDHTCLRIRTGVRDFRNEMPFARKNDPSRGTLNCL